MNILLINENIPENMEIFFIENVGEQDLIVFKNAHMKYVNSLNKVDDSLTASYLIVNPKNYHPRLGREARRPKEDCGKYFGCMIDRKVPFETNGKTIDLVISIGAYLKV